jgi:hypothetical protein
MRRLSIVFALLAIPAFAEEKAKPNTLTAKEIADGWILLFDGETTFGWKTEGEAKAKDGALIIGGKKAGSAQLNTPLLRATLLMEVSPDGKKWGTATCSIEGDVVAMEMEGINALDLPPAFFLTNKLGHFIFSVGDGESFQVRSVKARPEKMTSLFNGKDLTGWKEFKATKEKKVASQLTVTKEGWLNVKDGPGDLQTEGQWADFVVQLECISNGKHLNSGLFFRCLPDQYQQGYEAQIRNEWMGDDRTKPVDFGTGAIYRRQAARKVVSTDGEWFTMTVAAQGRHIATWVNGYQVADWTDDRKEHENARQGFKKGKGALSIQGHDATTDLSFRNIRIQSLDK